MQSNCAASLDNREVDINRRIGGGEKKKKKIKIIAGHHHREEKRWSLWYTYASSGRYVGLKRQKREDDAAGEETGTSDEFFFLYFLALLLQFKGNCVWKGSSTDVCDERQGNTTPCSSERRYASKKRKCVEKLVGGRESVIQ